MEKLREAIEKLCNSEPNAPLSPTKNSILQQRLTNFLSNLHITPDHPPYAWMIEKALRELDEEGGSTEDSISNFLKKEYDSLPWAHMTMLKHHLQKMSENGEIIMIDGGRFLLPGDSKSSNRKRKRRRTSLRKRRRSNSRIKRKKPQHKEKEEEKGVQHVDLEVVSEQKDLDEQQNEVTVGNRTQENWELNGHHNEPSTDKDEKKALDEQQNEVTVGNRTQENWELNGHHNEPSTDKDEQKDLDEQQNEVTVGNCMQENWELDGHHNEPSTDKDEKKALDEQQNEVTVENRTQENWELNGHHNEPSTDKDEQKDLDEQQNEVTVGNRTQENWELNGHHNEPSTDKDDGQLGDQQNSVTGNKVFHRRVQSNRIHKEKGKEQLDATEGSLQSSIAIRSGIGCNAGSVPIESPGFIMQEEIEHLQDSELQQLKLSKVEETADISNLYPKEILENEQPGDNVPQLLSPEAPPGFEFMVEEGAAANKAHTSSSVGLDSPKEDCVVHQSTERPGEEESVAKDMLKTKKQKKKHHGLEQVNMPTRTLTRAQSKAAVTPKSSETDRAQRQLKRWSKNPGEPKSVSTSKEERLPLCSSADQHLVRIKEPLSTSKPLCSSEDQHLVHVEEQLALVTREEVLNLIDPQHEVHLEQPKEQQPGRLLKYKEDAAKIDNSTTSALATNEEALCLDDPQVGVYLKRPKDKRRRRALKGKEDGSDPDTTLLKDLGLSKKLMKKQNDRGLRRRRNA